MASELLVACGVEQTKKAGTPITLLEDHQPGQPPHLNSPTCISLPFFLPFTHVHKFPAQSRDCFPFSQFTASKDKHNIISRYPIIEIL